MKTTRYEIPYLAGDDPGSAPEPITGTTYERPLLDRITNHATVARIEIDLYAEAGQLYAALGAREMELEADRAGKKQAAALRLIQTVNPLSGEKQTVYSATAAMDAASLDHEYRAHLQLQAEVVLEKGLARTRMETAKLRASLAVAMLRAEAGIA